MKVGIKDVGVQVEYEMGHVINLNRSFEQRAWTLHCSFRGFLERALTVGLVMSWLRHEPQKVSTFVKLKCPTALVYKRRRDPEAGGLEC